jgi:nucleoside-diphosphate-sugar epimerase
MIIGLTGHTGFLGKILYDILSKEHFIYTIGRRKSFLIYDFKSQISSLPATDIIVHCAGKAHVLTDKYNHNDFFTVNVLFTENLLNSLTFSKKIPSFFVYISSVSVYGKNYGISINENYSLDAKDPYGLSKILAEDLVKNWCKKNNVVCTILRLPLVVGQNPSGNLGDMIKAIKNGYYFNIAGGKAKKSMVLAEDVAKVIIKVAKIGGTFNLTDGYHPSFFEISKCISNQLNKSQPVNLHFRLVKLVASLGDLLGSRVPLNTTKLNKIISNLTFDDSKAKASFDWNPTPVLEGFKLVTKNFDNDDKNT